MGNLRWGFLTCLIPFFLAVLAPQLARAEVDIIPIDGVSVVDSSGTVQIRVAPNTPVNARGFHALVPDFAAGQWEDLAGAIFDWSLQTTIANQDYIQPDGTTMSDTTFFTAAARPLNNDGSPRVINYTLICSIVALLQDGTFYTDSGSINITVTWAKTCVTDIIVHPVLGGGGYYNTVDGFHLEFNQTIKGTSLDQCKYRQTIMISGTDLDEDTGNAVVPPQFAEVNLGVGQAPGTFDWRLDWDWTLLPQLNAANTQSLGYDDHTSGLSKYDNTLDPITHKLVGVYCPLATTDRFMKIDVCVPAESNQIIATHYWSYEWDNWNGRWLKTDNPPATHNWVAGGPHYLIVGGEFSQPAGLDGPLPSDAFVAGPN